MDHHSFFAGLGGNRTHQTEAEPLPAEKHKSGREENDDRGTKRAGGERGGQKTTKCEELKVTELVRTSDHSAA